MEGLTSEDAKVARRALWKMDLAVIPLVAMYYLLSFLDRSSVGPLFSSATRMLTLRAGISGMLALQVCRQTSE